MSIYVPENNNNNISDKIQKGIITFQLWIKNRRLKGESLKWIFISIFSHF